MIKKGKSTIALSLAAGMLFSSVPPSFAQSVPALRSEQQDALMQKAEKILKNKSYILHLLGTSFLHDRARDTNQPRVGTLHKVDGEPYYKDAFLVPPSTIETTPWYQIYQVAAQAKIGSKGMNAQEKAAKSEELDKIIKMYGIKEENALKDDGDYAGKDQWKMVKVVQASTDGNQPIYQKAGDDKEAQALFSEMEIVKTGNELEVLFITNKEKVSNIGSVLMNKVAGKDIRASLGGPKPEQGEDQKYTFLAVPIPAELNGEELVIESFSYTDTAGKKKTIGPFGLEINYKNLTKTEENHERFGKFTRIRADYWLQRADAVLRYYLDEETPKDKARIQAVKESVKKLSAEKASKTPSLTRVLKAAEPIYEVENIFTLTEKVMEKRNAALEDLETNKALTSAYTKESIASYKKHLEEMEKKMNDFDLADLVYADEEMNMAYRNTWLKYDTSVLQKLVDKAEKYQSQYYTAKSFANLTIAKENAKEWIKKNKTEQPSLNDTSTHIKALENAIKGLVTEAGKTPPVIEDETGPSTSSEKYSVPVSDGMGSFSGYLVDKAIYDKTNKNYIVEFKKVGKDFITKIEYGTGGSYTKAKVLEKEQVGDKTFVKKVEIPESAVKVVGGTGILAGKATYLSMNWEMSGNFSFNFKLDEKQKLQEGSGEKEKPTKPYEAKFRLENQDYGTILADKLLGVKAMYDPNKKEVTFTHYPIYDGSNLKTYITSIEYQGMNNIVTNATPVYGDTDKKVAKSFILKHDMEKSKVLNVSAVNRITLEKEPGSQKEIEKKGYDNVKVLFEESTQDDANANLAELNKQVTQRTQRLDSMFNAVKDMIAADAKENEKIIKTTVAEILAESVDITDAEALQNRLTKLEDALIMIQPWSNLKEGLAVEEQLNKYKGDERIDADSITKAEEVLNAVKTAMKTPMNRADAVKQGRKLNLVPDYVKLNAKVFKQKIDDGEQKIASGLYESEGISKLKHVLYESQEAPSKEVDQKTGKSPRDNYDKGVLGFYNDIVESYGKFPKVDPKEDEKDPDFDDGPSTKMLDLVRYDDLMARLDDALESLVEKSAAKFTVTFKTDKLTAPVAQEVAENGKAVQPDNFIIGVTECKDTSEDKTYVFKGWQLKGVDYDFKKPVTENIELVAKWELKDDRSNVNKFEVNFISEYKQAPTKVTVDEGKTIQAPEGFEKDVTTAQSGGKTYVFKGWFDGESEFNFNNPISINKTLKAKWEIKEDEPAPGKDELTNIKTVILHMLNAKEDKLSMGDAATWNKAKYYTKNGKTYLEGQMVPMQKIPDGVEFNGEKPTITGVVTKLEYKEGGEWKDVQVLKSEDYRFEEKNRTVKGITRFVIPVSSYAIQNHGMEIPIRMTYYTPVMDHGGELKLHAPEARFEVNFDPNRIMEGFNENDFKVDKGDLTKLIEETMRMLGNIKNESLFDAIKGTLIETIQVEKKQDATLDEVKEAHSKLSKSVQMVPLIEQIKLLLTQAKTDLDTSRLGEYTQASLKKVEAVLKEIESSYNSTLEYDKLAGYAKQLREIRDLYRYDTSRLESKIDEAKDKLKENISQEQKEILQSAINQAEAYVQQQNQIGVRAGNHVKEHMDALTKAMSGENPSAPSTKTYEVSFYSPYLTAPKAMQVEKGKTVTPPEGFVIDKTTAVKDGVTYIFRGWLGSDLRPFDFNTPITEKTLLTANWEVQAEKIPDETVHMRKGKVYEEGNESKESMLKSWFVEDIKTEQTAKGITYTLNFKPFDNKQAAVNKVSLTIGGKVYQGVVTIAEDKSATVVVETDMPMQEKMLLTMSIPAMSNVEKSAILKFTDTAPTPKAEKVTVTFITAYGTTPAAQVIEKNSKATAPAGFEMNQAFKDGNKTYLFKGWFKDGELFDFNKTAISNNITLIAKWEEKVAPAPSPQPPAPTPNPGTPKPSPSKPTPSRPGASSGHITVIPSGSAKADTPKEKLQQKPEQKPAMSSTSFVDTAGHWAKEAIDYVVAKGYFKGTSANTFAPNKTITRADFVTVLGRMAKVDQGKYTKDPFKDLGTNYYTSYVIWAAENGIVKGTGHGQFEPNRPITREEMAAIVAKFLEVEGKQISDKNNVQFKDASNIASWAQDSVEKMAKKGIIKGMDDGKFNPKSGFTRAQVAQVLMNIDKI